MANSIPKTITSKSFKVWYLENLENMTLIFFEIEKTKSLYKKQNGKNSTISKMNRWLNTYNFIKRKVKFMVSPLKINSALFSFFKKNVTLYNLVLVVLYTVFFSGSWTILEPATYPKHMWIKIFVSHFSENFHQYNHISNQLFQSEESSQCLY